MSRLLWSIPLISLILTGCSVLQQPLATPITSLPTKHLTIGATPLVVEVAATDAARKQGLSGRETLPEGRGMLFLFDRPLVYNFWMKDMNFALDFVWLNNGAVVELTLNVPPPTAQAPAPATIVPREAVDSVVEVPAGWIARHSIQVGDQAKFAPSE